ncbi:Leucine-responsive regulatory protein [Jannaschia aquimarina]|uniref:Lrp_9 protein n=2 Tax=Jannaschia aquimarina TaxID=935700 RepID=A0A0D1D3V2_9RHOB|nr:Lrp/AsnC family transcriptional regulator [Jannaschia aquimarina]KIT14773.1 Leucine-responsive regulatory protein [Jannaschia aquimarina]SNT42450.1 Lrp/AsnC family transcriptional regulator, leucine-responsive regulatory protein [Jannaschia aquimarina]
MIRGYGARLDEAAMGRGFAVFVSVKLDRQVEDALAAFEGAVQTMPEVMECWLMTGGRDYLLRVATKDLAAFERFLTGRLTRVPGVATIESAVPLREVKRT